MKAVYALLALLTVCAVSLADDRAEARAKAAWEWAIALQKAKEPPAPNPVPPAPTPGPLPGTPDYPPAPIPETQCTQGSCSVPQARSFRIFRRRG